MLWLLVRRRRAVHLSALHVDIFLRCLDRAAALAGLTRGAGRDVKSTVRLIGNATDIASFYELQEENWITDKIRDTCQILEPNSTVEILGTIIGLQKDRDNAFAERLGKLQMLREDLADIEDAGIELLLGRLCANTTKVSHLLRAHGCHISQQLLEKFDDLTATFVDVFSVAICTITPSNMLFLASTIAAWVSGKRKIWLRPHTSLPL